MITRFLLLTYTSFQLEGTLLLYSNNYDPMSVFIRFAALEFSEPDIDNKADTAFDCKAFDYASKSITNMINLSH